MTGPSTTSAQRIRPAQVADAGTARRAGARAGRCARSTGSAALTTATRTAAPRRAAAAPGRPRAAAASTVAPAGPAAARARRPVRPRRRTGRRARRRRRPERCSTTSAGRCRRPARSTSRPRPRPVVRSPVSTSSPAAASRRTLSPTVGLEMPVAVGQLGPGQPRCSISARSTCSSVSARSRSSDGFGGVHDAILVRSLA